MGFKGFGFPPGGSVSISLRRLRSLEYFWDSHVIEAQSVACGAAPGKADFLRRNTMLVEGLI